MFLKDIAHGRSGDKGNISNICIFAREEKDYPFSSLANIQIFEIFPLSPLLPWAISFKNIITPLLYEF